MRFGKAREFTSKAMPQISEILSAAFHQRNSGPITYRGDQGRLRSVFVKSEES